MWLNIISSTVSCGLLVAASSALVLFKHWISNNQRIDELEAATPAIGTEIPEKPDQSAFPFQYAKQRLRID